MKIALPTRENQVDSHFGRCEHFTVFTIDEATNQIVAQETVSSPVGCGCKSSIAQTLAAMGVKVMLAGNMGNGAVNALTNAGIEVVRGCSGDVKTVAEQWLAGAIKDCGDSCHGHHHGHQCHH